jgi:hypothetical protein
MAAGFTVHLRVAPKPLLDKATKPPTAHERLSVRPLNWPDMRLQDPVCGRVEIRDRERREEKLHASDLLATSIRGNQCALSRCGCVDRLAAGTCSNSRTGDGSMSSTSG